MSTIRLEFDDDSLEVAVSVEHPMAEVASNFMGVLSVGVIKAIAQRVEGERLKTAQRPTLVTVPQGAYYMTPPQPADFKHELKPEDSVFRNGNVLALLDVLEQINTILGNKANLNMQETGEVRGLILETLHDAFVKGLRR